MTIAFVWTLVSLLGLARQLYTWKEAITDKRSLGGATNGRLVIADEQIEAAWQHALVQFLFLCAGILALTYPLPVDENPDLTVRAVTLPLLLMGAQITAVIRHERAARVRRILLGEHKNPEQADRIEQTVTDTNRRVTEMYQSNQQTADDRSGDRPLEEADRVEGREHRQEVEDKLKGDQEVRAEERRLDREERAQERADDREERRDERQEE